MPAGNNKKQRRTTMKKLLSSLRASAALAALALALALIPSAGASAAGTSLKQSTSKDIDYVTVDSVDNIQYPSTDDFIHQDKMRTWSKLELSCPAVVKVYYSWDSSTGNTTIRGTAWFSNDEDGVNAIGAQTALSKSGTSMVAFLDSGTYYVNQVFDIKEKGQATYDYISIGALIQKCPTDVSSDVTSFSQPSTIKLNTNYKGFLSANSNYDYYMFAVSEAGRLDISYNFEEVGGNQVGRGTVVLYDADKKKLGSKTFAAAAASTNVLTYYCDPGVYYVELSGCTGPTLINAGYTDYTIKAVPSTKKLTNSDVWVEIQTPMQPTEALMVAGEYGQSKINDGTVWSTQKGAVNFIDDMGVAISENGTYTVRLRDASNKYYLATFTVSNIDKEAPEVKGVENGVTYSNKDVTIKFSDENLKSAKLDGKEIEGKSVSLSIADKGKHTLVVTDKAGNKTKIKFKLKYTEAYYYKVYKQKGATRVAVKCDDKKNVDKLISVSGFKISVNTNVVNYDKFVSTLNKNKTVDRKAVKEIVKQYTFEEIVNADGTINEETYADISRAINSYYKETYLDKNSKKRVTGVTVSIGVVNE